MFLSELKLWDFRKFGSDHEINLKEPDLVVSFNKDFNLLVGENDSGKSCIIDAIKLVLKTHASEWIKVNEEDFHNKKIRLRIECIFKGFNESEGSHFTEWLGWEKTENGDSKPYLRLILDVKRTDDRISPYEVRAGCDNEGKQLNPEAKEYLKTTYLKPLRDAQSELIPRRNSRLSQILIGHPIFKDKKEHELVKIFEDANKKIENFFKEKESSKNITKGFTILNDLNNSLSEFLSNNSQKNANFDIVNPVLKDILEKIIDFFNETSVDIYEGHKILKDLNYFLSEFQTKTTKMLAAFSITDPDLKAILEKLQLNLEDQCCGLGTYNLLFIATELLHLKRENYNGLKLGLIEEIEAHLHPQAQLRVIQALQAEAEKSKIQLIVTTHSPNLASKIHLENLIICKDGSTFRMGSDSTKLRYEDYSFLERFLDVTKANLFFARGVILVEGDTENLLIPTIARIIDKGFAENGVSIVHVGGKDKLFLRYSRIFLRKDNNKEIKIPVAIITDLDVKPDDEDIKSNDRSKKEDKIKELEKRFNDQKVKVFISPHWTLEYCIALSSNLREIFFEAIRKTGNEMADDGYSGKRINEDFDILIKNKTNHEIALEIYENIILKKEISKPMIAQHFSELLEKRIQDENFKNILKEDTNIKYIIDAIDYVTTEI